MYHLAESIRIISGSIQPFMTKTPGKIWSQLGIEESLTSWDSTATFGQLPAGTKVGKGDPIFPRLDVEEEVAHIVELMGGKVEESKEPEEIEDENQITIEDFSKVELRVAEVTAAEPVQGADRLLKIQLDLGYEQRQVVSGIAKVYKPEELVGKKVICVANLKPVKLRGELSQGMILAGSKGEETSASNHRWSPSKWSSSKINKKQRAFQTME